MDVRALYVPFSLISTDTFVRALTVSVDRCAETECPFSGVSKNVAESGGRRRKTRVGVRELGTIISNMTVEAT